MRQRLQDVCLQESSTYQRSALVMSAAAQSMSSGAEQSEAQAQYQAPAYNPEQQQIDNSLSAAQHMGQVN